MKKSNCFFVTLLKHGLTMPSTAWFYVLLTCYFFRIHIIILWFSSNFLLSCTTVTVARWPTNTVNKKKPQKIFIAENKLEAVNSEKSNKKWQKRDRKVFCSYLEVESMSVLAFSGIFKKEISENCIVIPVMNFLLYWVYKGCLKCLKKYILTEFRQNF
jgi:hypothetical protein